MGAARMDDDPMFVRLRDAMLADVPPTGGAPRSSTATSASGTCCSTTSIPTALIDWEIWSVGDPLVDVAWFVQFTDADNFPGIGRPVPGTPTAAEVMAALPGPLRRAAAGRRTGSWRWAC